MILHVEIRARDDYFGLDSHYKKINFATIFQPGNDYLLRQFGIIIAFYTTGSKSLPVITKRIYTLYLGFPVCLAFPGVITAFTKD